MQLRFSPSMIEGLSREYDATLSEHDHRVIQTITYEVVPSYLAKRFLTKDEILDDLPMEIGPVEVALCGQQRRLDS